MRTPEEIKTEIAALKALKPVGRWADRTQETIKLLVEELEEGVDDTSEEFEGLTEGQQEAVKMAREWKEEKYDDKPSEGWGDLVRA